MAGASTVGLDYDPALVAAVTTRLTDPQPCRYCGDPSWSADEHGPTHACCAGWQLAGRRCPGCIESQVAWAEYWRRYPDRDPRPKSKRPRRAR